MASTLLLDQLAWDLVLDASGNIALATEPYSQAQDAASALRTFLGEVYYNTLLGVPYFQRILGKAPSAQFIKAAFVEAALTVPGIASAVCFLGALGGRKLVGQVQLTNTTGQRMAVTAPVSPGTPIVPDAAGWLNFSDPGQSGWITTL